jgi:tripartite-type tricarboxylate transporter receptor subunit TctC
VGTGWAQDFPSKPVRIVTAAAGGTGDFTTRTLAKGISDSVGWTTVVDNRPGGLSAIESVVRAPPDGYTLLVDSLAFLVGPLRPKIFYDMAADFAPVAMLSSSPAVVVVHPSLGVKTIKELVALAKARPAELNYGSTGNGGIAHLTGELFKSMSGVNIVHIPYKSTAMAMTEVISGQVQLMFVPTGPAAPHIKSGRLRGLAVTCVKPSLLFPGVPTVAETLPGFESNSLVGIFAPQKTSAAVINRLNMEILRALRRDDVKERYLSFGVEPAGSSPEELGTKINAEMAKWTKVVAEAGIKPL